MPLLTALADNLSSLSSWLTSILNELAVIHEARGQIAFVDCIPDTKRHFKSWHELLPLIRHKLPKVPVRVSEIDARPGALRAADTAGSANTRDAALL